jgi:hypothetical protein
MSDGRDVPKPAAGPAVKADRPAVLKVAAATRRVDALFRATATDFLLREQFVTDPAQVLSEYVRGSSLPPERALVTNQLLYSVLSNRPLLVWLRNYTARHHGRPPARQQILADFSRAVVAQGGHHVVTALIRSSVEQEAVVGLFDESLVHLLFDGSIFADDDGTGGQEGTGPGTGGTDEGTDSGTEMTPGTDDGTDSGTEQSTGTSTEKSGSGFFGSKYVLTLNALVQYANQLKQTGALDAAIGG